MGSLQHEERHSDDTCGFEMQTVPKRQRGTAYSALDVWDNTVDAVRNSTSGQYNEYLRCTSGITFVLSCGAETNRLRTQDSMTCAVMLVAISVKKDAGSGASRTCRCARRHR